MTIAANGQLAFSKTSLRRPIAVASAALVGAGIFALTPMAQRLPDIHTADVQLVTTIDPITPWLDAFDTASANATQTFDFVSESANALQQALAGQSDLLSTLETAFSAATFIGEPAGTQLAEYTLDADHLWALQYISGLPVFAFTDTGTIQIPAIEPADQLLNYLSSPMSGVLVGFIGPVVSPEVSLLNSFDAISADLTGSDWSQALQDVLAAPANAIGAFFDGATLNLDPLADALNTLFEVPEGSAITGAEFAFGGLFSDGLTQGLGTIADESNLGLGGSLFNSLGLDILMAGMGDMPWQSGGEAIGPIGALADLSQVIAEALGSSASSSAVDAGGDLTNLLTSIF